MATQPPAPPPGNGRESLGLTIGTKSLGIQAANLTSILLLLILGVGGYLLWVATDRRLEALLVGQAQVLGTSTAHKEAMIEALHNQRAYIVEVVHQGQQRQEQQAEVLQRLLLILELPPDIMGGAKPLKPPVGP